MPNFLDDEGRCRCYLHPEDPGHRSDCIYRDRTRPEREGDALEKAAREIAGEMDDIAAMPLSNSLEIVLAIMRRYGLRGPKDRTVTVRTDELPRVHPRARTTERKEES